MQTVSLMKGRKEEQLNKRSKGKRYDFSVVAFAFFLISFLGWAYETLLMLVWHGKFYDRGFLFLPFCPIYGFPVCALYLLIGTPTEGRFSSFIERRLMSWKKVPKALLRDSLYYLLSGGFATLVELIVGLILERAGLCLWTYCSQPFNFRGHICLQVSLLWGLMLTVFMRFAMPFLLKLVQKIPRRARIALCVLFSVCLLVDFSYQVFQRLA